MRQITITAAYQIGELVYLRTDPEQHERMIIGYAVARGTVLYELACGVDTSPHYDFEITNEKDISKI